MSLIEKLCDQVTAAVLTLALLLSALAVILKQLLAICKYLKEIHIALKGRTIKIKLTIAHVRRAVKALQRSAPLFLVVFFLTVVAAAGINMWRKPRFSFRVSDTYRPTGKMGDIGDVEMLQIGGMDRFVYEVKGRGPHEYEWKYVNGELNDRPAQFSGVMYQHPPNNWGTDPNGGWNLCQTRDSIAWEARSGDQEVFVEFLIGGINWIWDEEQRKRVRAPYPDSMPHTSLGIKKLTASWQSFQADLKEKGLDTDEYFKKVIGGFGWSISWAPNGIQLNEKERVPNVAKKFQLEIRNIRYERR